MRQGDLVMILWQAEQRMVVIVDAHEQIGQWTGQWIGSGQPEPVWISFERSQVVWSVPGGGIQVMLRHLVRSLACTPARGRRTVSPWAKLVLPPVLQTVLSREAATLDQAIEQAELPVDHILIQTIWQWLELGFRWQVASRDWYETLFETLITIPCRPLIQYILHLYPNLCHRHNPFLRSRYPIHGLVARQWCSVEYIQWFVTLFPTDYLTRSATRHWRWLEATPLRIAIHRGDAVAVQALIMAGAPVDTTCLTLAIQTVYGKWSTQCTRRRQRGGPRQVVYDLIHRFHTPITCDPLYEAHRLGDLKSLRWMARYALEHQPFLRHITALAYMVSRVKRAKYTRLHQVIVHEYHGPYQQSVAAALHLHQSLFHLVWSFLEG